MNLHRFTPRGVRRLRQEQDRIGLADPPVRAALEAAPPGEPLVGFAADGRPVYAAAGHVLVAGGAGAGKSTVLAGLVSQHVHRGGMATILDIRWWPSQGPAAGLARVTHSSRLGDIAKELVALDDERGRRSRLAQRADLADNPAEQPIPHLLVIEDLPITRRLLAHAWADELGANPVQPRTAPAVQALDRLLYCGREVGITVAVATNGGPPQLLEQFPTRVVLAGTRQLWRRVAPAVDTPPDPLRWRGWGHVVTTSGDQAITETHLVDWTGHAARTWAIEPYRLDEGGDAIA